jgi:hypothetical protein
MSMASDETRAAKGRDYEGYAFTFCKAAFLALLFSRYTLLITATLSVIFYVLAYLYGVREWGCFAKPPWVIVFWLLVAIAQISLLFFHYPKLGW